jgi:hypothetical protein
VPIQTLNPTNQEFLQGRHIAAIATENADGTIHLTAVWYLFEDGHLFVAVFASYDDVTIRLTPASWITWVMAVLDAQALGGRLGSTPGYMLPLV